MSQSALAQSATALSVSTPKNIDFDALIVKHATRNCTGMTQARFSLNAEKLKKRTSREIKSLRGIAISENLPADINSKLDTAIDTFIATELGKLKNGTLIHSVSKFVYDKDEERFVKHNIVTSEEILALKEERLAVTLKLTASNKRLKMLRERNEDPSKITQAEATVAKFEQYHAQLEAEIQAQAELVKPVSK